MQDIFKKNKNIMTIYGIKLLFVMISFKIRQNITYDFHNSAKNIQIVEFILKRQINLQMLSVI